MNWLQQKLNVRRALRKYRKHSVTLTAPHESIKPLCQMWGQHRSGHILQLVRNDLR